MNRALAIIKRCIREQNLNLQGKTILTEVGTNAYIYTPIIPLLAGASKVIAWANDGNYGKATEIEKSFSQILTNIKFDGEVVVRLNERNIKDIQESDLITNSGNIRPINSDFLQNCKSGSVIPLMYEAWEIRESDIDIEYCRKKNIPVAGTWENHPSIKVFEYVGLLAAKLIFEAGLEIKENKVWIWSDDDFGVNIKNTLERIGVSQAILSVDINLFFSKLSEIDLLFLSDYSETRMLLGTNGLIDLDGLKEINPNITIVHLYGKVEVNELNCRNIFVYPNKNGLPHVMTETLGYLGLEPLIRLQVAGFKVGEQLLKNNLTNLAQFIN